MQANPKIDAARAAKDTFQVETSLSQARGPGQLSVLKYLDVDNSSGKLSILCATHTAARLSMSPVSPN
jgi:hypothetical protein